MEHHQAILPSGEHGVPVGRVGRFPCHAPSSEPSVRYIPVDQHRKTETEDHSHHDGSERTGREPFLVVERSVSCPSGYGCPSGYDCFDDDGEDERLDNSFEGVGLRCRREPVIDPGCDESRYEEVQDFDGVVRQVRHRNRPRFHLSAVGRRFVQRVVAVRAAQSALLCDSRGRTGQAGPCTHSPQSQRSPRLASCVNQSHSSPRLNVIASNGRMLIGSSSCALAMSSHCPSCSSKASRVRSTGSMSHRWATPSRA